MLKNWSLRTKIISLGVLLPTILVTVLFVIYFFQSKQWALDAYVEKARAICLTAESTRDEMEDKWEKGVFSAEILRDMAETGGVQKVLLGVPVVTAWRAAMLKADEGGYTFKVPKFHPRNPKNEPDDIEAEVLKKLENEHLNEYYVVDKKLNAVRYFRPVKLSQSCMLCHGDPKTSQALWGNDQGLDPTGGKMENWKVGEVHGAFEVVQSLDKANAKVSTTIGKGIILVIICLIATGLVFFLMVYIAVDKPVGIVTDTLSNAATEVNNAAGQVSGSSQRMAEGANSQASSLQETSASLHEMSSQIRKTAENSSVADSMTREAKKSAASGVEAMKRMASAIDEIKDSSDQTAKIIKTIDEIAFQTNLLALNAAVEAARAGEAGKGFAVVAEEVRNLAQRSAEAAKNTAALINQAQSNSDNGVAVSKNVADILRDITEKVDKVTEIIAEVSAASNEQAQGIDQINKAVTQIDSVTQSNASAAEQSAAASEELSAQSAELQEMVQELVYIVNGFNAGSIASSRGGARKSSSASNPVHVRQNRSVARVEKDSDYRDF